MLNVDVKDTMSGCRGEKFFVWHRDRAMKYIFLANMTIFLMSACTSKKIIVKVGTGHMTTISAGSAICQGNSERKQAMMHGVRKTSVELSATQH